MKPQRIPGYPTEMAIRTALVMRVHAFCRRTGIAPSTLGRAAIRDAKFLARVEAGENFTIQNYQRVHDYIDRELKAGASKQVAAE